jgi:hypothetical protein
MWRRAKAGGMGLVSQIAGYGNATPHCDGVIYNQRHLRPSCNAAMMLRNAALNAMKYKSELAKVRSQNVDIRQGRRLNNQEAHTGQPHDGGQVCRVAGKHPRLRGLISMRSALQPQIQRHASYANDQRLCLRKLLHKCGQAGHIAYVVAAFHFQCL